MKEQLQKLIGQYEYDFYHSFDENDFYAKSKSIFSHAMITALTSPDILKAAGLVKEEEVKQPPTNEDLEREAELKYPIKMGYYNENPHGMYGTCDLNYYERQAYIEGRKMSNQQGIMQELIEEIDVAINDTLTANPVAQEYVITALKIIKQKATELLNQSKKPGQ